MIKIPLLLCHELGFDRDEYKDTSHEEIQKKIYKSDYGVMFCYLIQKNILKMDFFKDFLAKSKEPLREITRLNKQIDRLDDSPNESNQEGLKKEVDKKFAKLKNQQASLTTFWWFFYAWYAIKSIFGSKVFVRVKNSKKLLMAFGKNKSWSSSVEKSLAERLASDIKSPAETILERVVSYSIKSAEELQECVEVVAPSTK
ncbi:hypothetical protein MMH89_03845 [Candidatus Comchoanobacter bicostacola]|uniref:Uncharacterized protein n=1 Tax=Candidatus Comchoanobacter bicostacola TaxID=2919598 RepID=A0ABY5DJH0_9GAMM|nr:hypothetical protein [Candidatus Comchoanobacter bicostacola]UTC24350.1 hypothetical protein MMH89_03845 [Candidatus Comchoanobacter bicostacola]